MCAAQSSRIIQSMRVGGSTGPPPSHRNQPSPPSTASARATTRARWEVAGEGGGLGWGTDSLKARRL